MFCMNCGTSLPDTARFCSSCGTQTATATAPNNATAAAPAHHPQPPAAASYPSPPLHTPSPIAPLASSTALFAPNGYPQPAFNALAAALFHALDQNIQPTHTNGLEVSKMTAYRTLSGQTIPPYYGTHVLPTYAAVVGIELAAPAPPVVSWAGWHIFLRQKIRLEPEAAFVHVARVCAALGVPFAHSRADFPYQPDPEALAVEERFKARVYAMMRQGGGGGMGLGMGMGAGGGHHASSSSSVQSAAMHAMAKLAVKEGASLINQSMSGGAAPWFGSN